MGLSLHPPIEAQFAEGVHQSTDRRYALTSVPGRLWGSMLSKGPCHHKAEVMADECGTIADTDIASTWPSEYERRAYGDIV